MKRVRLGDLVEVVNEREDHPSESVYEKFVGLEHYDSGEMVISRWGSTEKLDSSAKVFHKGNVLVARRNVYLKRAAAVDFSGLTSGDSIVLQVLEQQHEPLIPFILNTENFWEYAEKHADGSMSKRLSPKVMLEYEFDLPDPATQQKLAAVLWAMERTKDAYKNLIAQTDEMVKARFVEMFGDPVVNSKGYPVKKLQELGEINRGVSKARPRNKPELLGGPYPLVQTGEVSAANLYITDYENTYSEIGLAQSKIWPAGTLCITIAANIAQTAILGFDACFPDSVCGFATLGEVTQIYVHFWFGFFQKILEEQAPQVAQRNINLKILREMDIMIPPIDLQEKFEKIVEKAETSKSAAQQSLSDLTAAQKALMRQYLG